ncbi:lipopolysaccharide heptosyltransferase II [Thermodesulfobacteriota bacterium]
MSNPITTYRIGNKWLAFTIRAFDSLGYLLFGTLLRPVEKDQVKKILVIRMDDIGDVIVATPAIQSLKENFPRARIDFLAKSSTRGLLEGNPHIHTVQVCDPFWMRAKQPFSLFQLIRLTLKLRHERYDLALELRGNPFNILLLFLSGSRRRAGYGAQGLGFLLTTVVPYDGTPKHETDRNLDILRGLGLDVVSHMPELAVTPAGCALAGNFLSEHRLTDHKRIVCIHAGAPWPARRWPPERFAALADTLIETHKAKVVFIGGPDERALSEGIQALMQEPNRQHACVAAGETTLPGLAALLKKGRLFIGNDSGPMHIACAVGTPAIGLFGPQTPASFGPCGASDTAIHKNTGCSPCVQKENRGCTKGLSCCEGLLAITPEDILEAITVRELL